LRAKVFGGLYHGRVLVLPEGTREDDLVELPETLPAGETFTTGRSEPEAHTNERIYRVTESRVTREKYLAYAGPMRFVRTIEVPPAPSIGVTVHLR
jgi:hypothetical protein